MRQTRLLVILILLVVAGGSIFWKISQQRAPQKEEEQAVITSSQSPEEVTKNFYEWYINCLNTPEKDCPYEANEYVSNELIETVKDVVGINPMLCAQDIPNPTEGTITLDKAIILGNRASTTIHTLYSWTNHPLTVELGLINGQWKITNVLCPQPE